MFTNISIDSLNLVFTQAQEQQKASVELYETRFDTKLAEAGITFETFFRNWRNNYVKDNLVYKASRPGLGFSIGLGCRIHQEDGLYFSAIEYPIIKDQNGLVNVAEALKQTFEKMARDTAMSEDGACAAAVVVVRDLKNNIYIITANVGDCRVVLKTKDGVYRLTKTHRPSIEEEKKYIQSNKGFVDNTGGMLVSLPDGKSQALRVSRSFGDKHAKLNGSRFEGEYSVCTLESGSEGELFLMTDGVEALHEQRIAELYADANFQKAENKADLMRGISYSIAQQLKESDNGSVVSFDLSKITQGFAGLVIDGHGDQGRLRNALKAIFESEFSYHLSQLKSRGSLHHNARGIPFMLIPDDIKDSFSKELDRFYSVMVAALPEDIHCFYPADSFAFEQAKKDKLAENRRLDFLPSAVYAGKRVEFPSSVTFVFDGYAFKSLTSAFDLWVPILQAIHVKKANIIFEIYEDRNEALIVSLKNLINDLKECFGIQVELAGYKIRNLSKQEIYILPSGILSEDVLAANIIAMPKSDTESLKYLINLANILGLEDKSLEQMARDGLTSLTNILHRYALAKFLRLGLQKADEKNVKAILPFVEPDSEQDEIIYASLGSFSSSTSEVPVVNEGKKEPKSYADICRITLEKIIAYNPEIPKKSPVVSPPPVVISSPPSSRVPPPVSSSIVDLEAQNERPRRVSSTHRWLWGSMMLASGLTTLGLVTYFGGAWIEETIKEHVTSNSGLAELSTLGAEVASGFVGGAVIPVGKKMLEGVSCCTRACCGLFFHKKREDRTNNVELTENDPLLKKIPSTIRNT